MSIALFFPFFLTHVHFNEESDLDFGQLPNCKLHLGSICLLKLQVSSNVRRRGLVLKDTNHIFMAIFKL